MTKRLRCGFLIGNLNGCKYWLYYFQQAETQEYIICYNAWERKCE